MTRPNVLGDLAYLSTAKEPYQISLSVKFSNLNFNQGKLVITLEETLHKQFENSTK